MRLTVKLGGPLRGKVSGHRDGELGLELPPEATVSTALQALGLSVAEVRVIMLNGRPLKADERLKDGDRLALFPPELAFNAYVAINFFNALIREKE